MGPDIRYAKTFDGVHVAHAVMGDGPPLVFSPPMVWCIEWAFEDQLKGVPEPWRIYRAKIA